MLKVVVFQSEGPGEAVPPSAFSPCFFWEDFLKDPSPTLDSWEGVLHQPVMSRTGAFHH